MLELKIKCTRRRFQNKLFTTVIHNTAAAAATTMID
jgi:hypothetical protein